jgi:hypothetical protein
LPALSPDGYEKKDRAVAPLAGGGVEDGEALSWDSAAGWVIWSFTAGQHRRPDELKLRRGPAPLGK